MILYTARPDWPCRDKGMNWRSWTVIITLLWIAALAAYGGLLYPRIDEDYGMYGTLAATLVIIIALAGVWWWAYTCAREDGSTSSVADMAFGNNPMNSAVLGALAGGTTVSVMLFAVNPFFEDNYGTEAKYIAAGVFIALLILIWLIYVIHKRRNASARRPPTI